mmetsp:Transcript_14222/g.23669  ORF Transcript_14222/g.23669 Transcript_14222/m.23669 type:complete len:214 (-) Transcript_14222:205-846(-)|eukprot:CAMPEP_0174973894 /NCGR_PEP_ID=MMETSP0004_2-20121128/11510_1 /TAXON_ID=420556 /ORGANISM="Ochromonas sp., Strain CCMP1393" /LENGTH=213 /DNA_ID=CAMNT_0016224423 /DNA_START=99 /DNA_END=740 /DNA_ORIENTATION=+
MSMERFKVVLLGEGRVGKTSILLRYTKGEYNDRQVSTLQASYLDKRVAVGASSVNLSIWDTAGQERFHALGPIYYRDASGALLVYDITDAESFNKVKNWVKELRKIVGNDIIIVIAGNKIDMEKNRNVDEGEAIRYAESVGAAHFHTSAKANRGLEEVFGVLAQKMLERKNVAISEGGGKAGAGGGGGGAASTKKQKLVIVDVPPPAKSSSCC